MNSQDTEQELELFELFESVDDLENAARKAAETAPAEYQHSAYLYYIARYFVALYEATFGQINIQVWNEYRNALDHYFRHITSAEDYGHLKKMELHIQRAALDIAKFYCHDFIEKFDKDLEKYDVYCLRLLDGGSFYRQVINSKRKAHHSFQYAKSIDSKLGQDNEIDKDILHKYLVPCFQYIQLDKIFYNRIEEIEHLQYELVSVKARAVKEAEKKSFGIHVIAGLVTKFIWGTIGLLLGLAITFFNVDIQKFGNDVMVYLQSFASNQKHNDQ